MIGAGTMRRMFEYFGDKDFRITYSYLDLQGIRHYVVEHQSVSERAGLYDSITSLFERYVDGKVYLIKD